MDAKEAPWSVIQGKKNLEMESVPFFQAASMDPDRLRRRGSSRGILNAPTTSERWYLAVSANLLTRNVVSFTDRPVAAFNFELRRGRV
jgi:hypothetical protein